MSTGGGGYPRWGRNTPRKSDLPFGATAIEHPPPPQELTEEEAEIWSGIVTRMPPDYFPSPTHPMLVALCRHIRCSRMFTQQLQLHEAELPHALNEERTKLLKAMMALSRASANESRTIAMLCTRLKLTQLHDSGSLRKARCAFLTAERPWDIPTDADDELPQ